MITVCVQHKDNYVNIEFPCTDNHMHSKLKKLNPSADVPQSLHIDEVHEPEALSALKGRLVNLDELNFLAKRIESFSEHEFIQFCTAVQHSAAYEMKDLINMTFNLRRYTLIQDMSNLEKVGEAHLLNKQGYLSQEDLAQTDFAAVGRALLSSGRGKITEYGLLFENEDIPFDEVYDGQVFPAYFYDTNPATATIEYSGKTEYAYLPDDDLAIEKAVRRLSASSLDDCSITLSNMHITNDKVFDQLNAILENEGLYAANHVVKSIKGFGEESLDKLEAVAEFADVLDSKPLAVLAGKLDCFIHIPNAYDYEDVARHLIGEHELSSELEDYFMFHEFGKRIVEDFNGRFLENGGFVCIDGDMELEDILETEDESMMMGGM